MGMPLGTANDTSTPSRSSRRSQCSRRAWCSWITKPCSPVSRGWSPAGSGVSLKSRLRSYSSSLRAIDEILTVGHSTHTFDRLVSLLEANGARPLIDVGKVPKSARMPWFRADALAGSLPHTGIAYAHEPRLGGFRRPRKDTRNGGWQVETFRGYADHMDSDEFRAGLENVEALARARRAAIMCAEAQWTRCHRRLIADALLVR